MSVSQSTFYSLQNLISVLSDTLKCPSRTSMTRSLAEKYEQMKKALIDELSSYEYLCTTADIWSTRHRSFLGI